MEPSEMAFEGRGRSHTHRLMKGQRDEDQELAIIVVVEVIWTRAV